MSDNPTATAPPPYDAHRCHGRSGCAEVLRRLSTQKPTPIRPPMTPVAITVWGAPYCQLLYAKVPGHPSSVLRQAGASRNPSNTTGRAVCYGDPQNSARLPSTVAPPMKLFRRLRQSCRLLNGAMLPSCIESDAGTKLASGPIPTKSSP